MTYRYSDLDVQRVLDEGVVEKDFTLFNGELNG
jgi:hypothetical protein